MRKMLTAASLMLAVVMIASSAHAESYTGTYSGGLVGAGLWVNTGDPDVGDFGGFSFSGTEGVPVSVTIADASGGPVAWTVSQDLNGDLTAGDPVFSEPTISGCGTVGSLAGSAFPFQEGFAITVFLRSVVRVNRSTGEVAPCPGVATHGTITLTTEIE